MLVPILKVRFLGPDTNSLKEKQPWPTCVKRGIEGKQISRTQRLGRGKLLLTEHRASLWSGECFGSREK